MVFAIEKHSKKDHLELANQYKSERPTTHCYSEHSKSIKGLENEANGKACYQRNTLKSCKRKILMNFP